MRLLQDNVGDIMCQQRFVYFHDALIQRVGVKHVSVNVDEMAAGSVHRWRKFFDAV